MAHPVIIVGAGIGGLAAAVALAARGVDVLVLEKSGAPGGKLRVVNGVDSGPTVFTMKWVFEELFAAANADFASAVPLAKADILARHWWPGGATLDLHAEVDASADAIGRFAGAEAARGFHAFAAESKLMYEILERSFIAAPRGNLLSLISRAGIGGTRKIRPFETLWRSLGRHFADPRLRQLFGRYATYCGSSPFAAPATLMLVAHVEQAGVWTIGGGMHGLALALETLARRHCAQFRYNTNVSSIDVARSRVSGVTLDSGERIASDTVVFNGDVAALPDGLLGGSVASAIPGVPRPARTLSAVTWSSTGDAQGFPLDRHNVFFSQDYAREFDDLYKGRQSPREPTVYVCAQDRGGGQHPARERLLCLVNAPPDGDTCTTDRSAVTARMRETLARCGFALDTIDPVITAPEDFARMYPGTGGALYGRSSHGWMASFQRPGARTRIPGLYLAGGSAHPGPGLPMAALSGRLAAQAIWDGRAST